MSPEAEALRDEVLSNDLYYAYNMALTYLREKTVFDADRWDANLWERLAATAKGLPAAEAKQI